MQSWPKSMHHSSLLTGCFCSILENSTSLPACPRLQPITFLGGTVLPLTTFFSLLKLPVVSQGQDPSGGLSGDQLSPSRSLLIFEFLIFYSFTKKKKKALEFSSKMSHRAHPLSVRIFWSCKKPSDFKGHRAQLSPGSSSCPGLRRVSSPPVFRVLISVKRTLDCVCSPVRFVCCL